MAALAAACQGDQSATAELDPFLDELAGQPDWAALGAVLRRILAGDRGNDLLDGLDPTDSLVVSTALERIAELE